MDAKTLNTLEYFKILERLAGYSSFAVSGDKARALRPTADIFEARRRLAETSEAVQMLITHADLSIGGARDIRAAVDLAAHGGVLAPVDLLDVKSTLIAARNLAKRFERLGSQYPHLTEIISRGQCQSSQNYVRFFKGKIGLLVIEIKIEIGIDTSLLSQKYVQ